MKRRANASKARIPKAAFILLVGSAMGGVGVAAFIPSPSSGLSLSLSPSLSPPLSPSLPSRSPRPSTSSTHSISSSSSSSSSSRLTATKSPPGVPIDASGWPGKFPAKEHCSRCGLCETTYVSQVLDACAFLGPSMSRMDQLEQEVHGRQRRYEKEMAWSDKFLKKGYTKPEASSTATEELPDEGRFGVMAEPMKLAKGIDIQDAQWTGVVTSIAVSMLETGQVDAVVCIGNSETDSESDDASSSSSSRFATPEPILARTVDDVLKGRGVKPSLAPSLAVLDQIEQDPTIRRLLYCGVGCSVQAFRIIQDTLNLEQVYVLGTNCADNSPTPKAAQNFLQQGLDLDMSTEDVQGYEFMQDFQVHVKLKDRYITKPYFTLPGNIAEPSIAPSCLTCTDYTNGLADVVVGYMGAPLGNDGGSQRMDEAYQTITVRNGKGSKMVKTAVQQGRLAIGDVATGKGSHEKLASQTVTSDSIIVSRSGIGAVPEQGMPAWLGNVMAFVISNTGPKGIAFARYSIDYHLLRNYFYLLDLHGSPQIAKDKMPQYACNIVQQYLKSDKKLMELQGAILEEVATLKL